MLGVPCGASSASALRAPRCASSAGLPQHPDEHRPERPVFLAVDQQLGERPRPGVPVELADPVGAVEVGQRQDVEQLCAGSGTEGIEAFTELSLDLLLVHGTRR